MSDNTLTPNETGPLRDSLTQLPVEVTVTVGRARPSIGELLQFNDGQIVALDRRVDDLVELYVGDRLVARGELQELDGDKAGQLAVCITEISEKATKG